MTIVKLTQLIAEAERTDAARSATWVPALFDLKDDEVRAKLALVKPEALPRLDRAIAVLDVLEKLGERLEIVADAADNRVAFAAAGLQRGNVVEYTRTYPGAKPQRMRLDAAHRSADGAIYVRGTLLRADGSLGKRSDSIFVSAEYSTPYRVLGVWCEPERSSKKRGPR